jgi:hypothetical protein
VVRLQQANMEDLVQFYSYRQLQLVRDVANSFTHLEWTIVLWPQLAAALDVKRRHRSVQNAEPHPLANGELDLPVLAIVEGLVMLLCLLQSISNLHQEFIMVHESLKYCWQKCLSWCMPY